MNVINWIKDIMPYSVVKMYLSNNKYIFFQKKKVIWVNTKSKFMISFMKGGKNYPNQHGSNVKKWKPSKT